MKTIFFRDVSSCSTMCVVGSVNCFFEFKDFLVEWGCRGRVKGYNAVRKLGRAFPEQSHKGERRRLLSSDRNKAATWPEGRVAYSFLFRFPDYSPFPHSQGDLATSTCVHQASLSLRIFPVTHSLRVL
jgi:hypothetical protein